MGDASNNCNKAIIENCMIIGLSQKKGVFLDVTNGNLFAQFERVHIKDCLIEVMDEVVFIRPKDKATTDE